MRFTHPGRGLGSVRRRPRRAAIVASALAAAVGVATLGGTASQAQEFGPTNDVINPEWFSNTLSRALDTGNLQNNLTEGAIARRDKAIQEWNSANPRTRNPLAKPNYILMWSGKANAGDVSGHDFMTFLTNGTLNPEGLKEFGNIQFGPGLDGWQVIDARKLNINGSRNPDYARVVNFVQMPLPGGLEGEPHHMQYEWADGDPIVAGTLFTDWTFVLDPKDIPNLKLTNEVNPIQTPLGSVPDAYDGVGGGRFAGTYMGGPNFNFAGSPGSIVVFKPDPAKGLVFESETPSGNIGGIYTGNAGGVPEPCSVREARPLGTCANPHGIQARPDLGVMVTSDYAEPRELTLDPTKPVDQFSFRPTIRTFDISNPAKPVLTSVAHMPKSPKNNTNRGHDNLGIMENAKTYGAAKGAFAGSMCGGGIFFTPDITKLKGDASDKWVEVWNDGLSEIFTDKRDALGIDGSQIEEPGGCAGGAWHQVSKNNKWFYRSVQGRVPLSTNFYDQGTHKMVYNISIDALMKSAQDGSVECNMSQGMDLDGDGNISHDNRETPIDIWQRLAEGETVKDCPKHNDSIVVDDRTTGGPHWAALDNHTTNSDGNPTRLVFSDYFVARLGVDGNHRAYMVNLDPDTQKMSFDKQFRDEMTGAIGVDFNRRNWPGSPDAGFYKPHSMVWVCPPGICTDDYPANARARSSCTPTKKSSKRKASKRKASKRKASTRRASSSKAATKKAKSKSKKKSTKRSCARKRSASKRAASKRAAQRRAAQRRAAKRRAAR
jgi:hypothetical protein